VICSADGDESGRTPLLGGSLIKTPDLDFGKTASRRSFFLQYFDEVPLAGSAGTPPRPN
jgi:hypothetical protein